MPPPQTRSMFMFASTASLDQPLVALGVERADERVAPGSSSAPRAKIADAVEHEAEEARAGLVGVGPLVELERAHPDAALAHVDLLVARLERHPQVVQRGLAEVVRPPQRRVLEREVGGRRAVARASRSRPAAARRRPAGAARSAPQPALAGEALGLDVDRHQRLAARSASVEKFTRVSAAPRSRRSSTGRQMPMVGRRGPQSQPKPYCALRIHTRSAVACSTTARGRAGPRARAAGRSGSRACSRRRTVGDVERPPCRNMFAWRPSSSPLRNSGVGVEPVEDEPQPLVGARGQRPSKLARYHHSRSSIHAHRPRCGRRRGARCGPRRRARVWTSPGTSTGTQSPAASAAPSPGAKSHTSAVVIERPHPCERPRCRRRHYFTPPAVSPRTIHRCAARKAITTGALTTMAAAMSWFQKTLVCDE